MLLRERNELIQLRAFAGCSDSSILNKAAYMFDDRITFGGLSVGDRRWLEAFVGIEGE